VAPKSLVKWLKILWENWRMSTWCVVCYLLFYVSCAPVSLPAAGGFAPPFIDQGGGGLHARRAI
jgi:hypothetical protein